MKFKRKENNDNKTIIVVETGLFKREKKFIATEKIAGKFYNWLTYPDYKMVPDNISFQLDEWNKNFN